MTRRAVERSTRIRFTLRRLGLVALVVPFVLSTACGADREEGRATLADSAGVEVVTSSGSGSWVDGEAWRVVHDLTIGGAAETEPAKLFGRIGGVSADSAGRIFVLDGQANEVRVFDPGGRHFATYGGQGSGPGEMSESTALIVDDDGTVYVPDLDNGRITGFRDGNEPSIIPFRFFDGGSGALPLRWDLLHDGRIVVHLRGVQGIEEDNPSALSISSSDALVAIDPTGMAPPDTFATLPAGGSIEFGRNAGPMGVMLRILAPEPAWALLDDGVVVKARTDEYRLHYSTPEGELIRIAHREVAEREVTDADREAVFAAARQTLTEQGIPEGMLDPLVRMIGFAETYPAFARLRGGPEGTLWVQGVESIQSLESFEIRSPEDLLQTLGGPDWEVFDRGGRLLGTVSLPENFEPMTWRGAYIYGVLLDELEIESAARFRIVKGAG